jgi:hypothetical protein
MIQLPESTVENVKVFITEIPGDFVDVFFLINKCESLQKIRSANLSRCDSSRITFVDRVENTSNDSDCILFLKFGMIGEKFQTLRKRQLSDKVTLDSYPGKNLEVHMTVFSHRMVIEECLDVR